VNPAATSAAAVVSFPVPSARSSRERRRLAHDEKPSVRLHRHGPETLSDTELIALLTRTRVSSEEDLCAARVLLRDGLAQLVQRVLTCAADIPRGDATRIAAIELGRRAIAPPSPRQLYYLGRAGPRLAARYACHVQERLGALFLDTRGRIIAEREVFVGTLHTAIVSTRDVLQLALSLHAKGVVVFHNHPSMDTQPSDEDVAYTRRLASAAQLLDIDLVDHLVLAGDRYISMKDRGDF
jgi:DNA repair protein RadC